MIGFNIHNVTELVKARVCTSESDGTSGWIVLNVIAENFEFADEGQDRIPSEITLYCKNVELTITQLQDQLALAVAKNRRELVEKKAREAAEAANEMLDAHQEVQKIIDAGAEADANRG